MFTRKLDAPGGVWGHSAVNPTLLTTAILAVAGNAARTTSQEH